MRHFELTSASPDSSHSATKSTETLPVQNLTLTDAAVKISQTQQTHRHRIGSETTAHPDSTKSRHVAEAHGEAIYCHCELNSSKILFAYTPSVTQYQTTIGESRDSRYATASHHFPAVIRPTSCSAQSHHARPQIIRDTAGLRYSSS
jgi:hypothetical protein